MQHLRLTACITNRVALLISPPQGRDGGSTILAGDDHSRVLRLALQGCNIDSVRVVRDTGLYFARGRLPALEDVQTCALGNPVVVCRATAAAFRASRAIATATARARPLGRLVRSNILGPSSLLSSLRAGFFG